MYLSDSFHSFIASTINPSSWEKHEEDSDFSDDEYEFPKGTIAMIQHAQEKKFLDLPFRLPQKLSSGLISYKGSSEIKLNALLPSLAEGISRLFSDIFTRQGYNQSISIWNTTATPLPKRFPTAEEVITFKNSFNNFMVMQFKSPQHQKALSPLDKYLLSDFPSAPISYFTQHCFHLSAEDHLPVSTASHSLNLLLEKCGITQKKYPDLLSQIFFKKIKLHISINDKPQLDPSLIVEIRGNRLNGVLTAFNENIGRVIIE